ncbi:MAG TPA: ABC transporter ATP-binding protein [Gemmataceae bacterium]|jgi:ABC-type multidrug transport system ATPase subunit
MPDDPLVTIRGLTVRYGHFTAVAGLDLHLRRGEVVGLVGPNGAGKTTVLRVLTGQQRPTAGVVTVAGRDIVRDWPAVKPIIGYAPDRDNHFDEFTARRNLLFFAGLYGVGRERVADCLRLVELDDAADVPVRGYSLGMRRKLLLARAVLHRPVVLYLDEPTAHLDAHSAGLVRRVVADAAADGCAVLVATHDLAGVEESCDRVAVLHRGRLIGLGPPSDLARRAGGASPAFRDALPDLIAAAGTATDGGG